MCSLGWIRCLDRVESIRVGCVTVPASTSETVPNPRQATADKFSTLRAARRRETRGLTTVGPTFYMHAWLLRLTVGIRMSIILSSRFQAASSCQGSAVRSAIPAVNWWRASDGRALPRPVSGCAARQDPSVWFSRRVGNRSRLLRVDPRGLGQHLVR